MVRNAQFNSSQTMTFADVPAAALSRATPLAGVIQQLSQGFGISVAATLLGLVAGSESRLSVDNFHSVFLLLAAIPLLSLFGFVRLHPNDGAVVSRHRVPNGNPSPLEGEGGAREAGG